MSEIRGKNYLKYIKRRKDDALRGVELWTTSFYKRLFYQPCFMT